MLNRRQAAPLSLWFDVSRTLAMAGATMMLVVFLTMAIGIRHEVDELLDDALQEATDVLYGSLVLHAVPGSDFTADKLPAPPHEERLVWQLIGRDQRVILRSHKAPATPLLNARTSGHHGSVGPWRIYAMALPQTGQMLLVGRSATENLQARYEAILIVGASGLLAGAACVWWMRRRVARALQPLRDLSAQIQAYDPMQPATMLAPPSRQEFVEVRAAILELGARLAQRVEQEQAFAAHAAHALRTPLAAMDAQLAVAMQELPASAGRRLARVREAANRLTRVISALLSLFRSPAGLAIRAVQLDGVLSHLECNGLQVTVDQDTPLRADANLLAAVLYNLLDNARRAGARHCHIVVRPCGNGTALELRDDGTGLPQARIDRLLRSTQRSGDDDGVGFGLRLATLIARAHRGRLTLARGTADYFGLLVRISFWEHGPEPGPSHR